MLCRAGPPFLTDDPEPVELHHWEVYVASQVGRDGTDWTGTAPFVEINYGAVHNVQLHVGVPLAWDRGPNAVMRFGLGDVELGAKIRVIEEESAGVQVGVYPILFLPTGDASRELGSGHVQLFLPIWVQKSWGAFTTYGGVGYTLTDGPHEQNRWFVGWQAGYRLAPWVTLGAEIFVLRADPDTVDVGTNVGAIFDLDDVQHILVSVGGRYDTVVTPQAYVAYQLTFGPPR